MHQEMSSCASFIMYGNKHCVLSVIYRESGHESKGTDSEKGDNVLYIVVLHLYIPADNPSYRRPPNNKRNEEKGG